MRRPPRLVTRTLGVTFITVAVILSVVFTVLLVDARDRVRATELEKLRVGERAFSRFEALRQREQAAALAAFAEGSTLNGALDAFLRERSRPGGGSDDPAPHEAVAREAERLATLTSSDLVATLDPEGRVFASGGPAARLWRTGQLVPGLAGSRVAPNGVAVLPAGAFRYVSAPIRFGEQAVGTLLIGTILGDDYARELARLSDAGIVITVNDAFVAGTANNALTRAVIASIGELRSTMSLNGEEYAIRPLLSAGPARIYMLASIDAAARAASQSALLALGTIALWAFVLAAFASLWLARTLTDPINRVSGTIATMTAARDFSRTLEPTGTSRELDVLAASFNELMGGLTAAEAETRAAYLGTIRALAAALDARDPYTAGHSERVSRSSVVIARQMGLPDADVAIIRLGALLHDIGKIGLADDILQKPEALTREEFEQIKRHPALGARILRQVSFLEPHLPIVELHHERPDGHGYPFGLRGDEIPLAARIVHVADAYDAMTSARAYRPARPLSTAVAELRLYAGTQFDPECVQAFTEALMAAPYLVEQRPSQPTAITA
ncbi:MAG TPA: HD domain-containing phosphohydrolase [Vicinamibacterales bacterium]